ncbi:AAA domain-containing protein [Cytobacillus depressus]|uniref:AAA domain-containing protein n=1 Tax=Cytobacillus depressus TaxID=1602942 RepID=A0A6L3V4Y9_9BACI|nr:sigma 54-interacting transcriptional regulator [Cytobacillus depressus]KAB2336184.1 AAA domain-containing protein [Cytobacillus depressus]
MKQSLTLIAGSRQTKQVLYEQLQQLLGDYVQIEIYSTDEGLPTQLTDDFFLFSSEVTRLEAHEACEINGKEMMVGKRTIHHRFIGQLLKIPVNSDVLIVNDDDTATIEVIESLYQLGIDHLRFIPYKKDQIYYENIDIAISPGETHLCPPSINKVIDIGVRLFDMATILKVVEYFCLGEKISSLISERYIRNIIDLQRELSFAEQNAKQMKQHIQNVVNTVDDGIIAINKQHRVTVFNRRLGALFHLPVNDAINRQLEEVIVQQDLIDFILNGNEESKFFTIYGVDLVIFRHQMETEDTIVATFKSIRQAFEVEKMAQRELKNKGFYAKYDFNDIVGDHPLLKETKQIAKKLALSEHPILIQGETGTGKELFAHSIHLHSMRKNGPFIAINCSALTENLLESELFGYEEGAFTGAQKGGKKGLFELADNGTIFLDEIGDISLTVQSHLLRVLQEKELRRIGGRKVIPINVRVIAATNKDIQQKSEEGSFRSDLFYRLNVLTLSVPPLRDRKTDIPLLVKHFITKSGKWVKVEENLPEQLQNHEWLGNIRELKSTIDYMLTICDGNKIEQKDIPYNRFQKNRKQEIVTSYPIPNNLLDMDEYKFILETIKQCNDNGKPASRQHISMVSEETGSFLSPQQVRRRLDYLESKGFITKGRGRSGTKITMIGVEYLHQLELHAT